MHGKKGTDNRKAGVIALSAVLAKPVDGYHTRAHHALRRGVILTQVKVLKRDFIATPADLAYPPHG